MTRTRLWAGAIAFASVVSGQETEPVASVEGVTVHFVSGEPMPNVRLELRRDDGGYYATSLHKGEFVFSNVAPGVYRLSASRAGFLNQIYRARQRLPHATVLALKAGDRVKGLVIRLAPQTAISGRVLDEAGQPVAGASVRAISERAADRGTGGTPEGGASSNDRGEYRIAGLQPGTYYVYADMPHPAGGSLVPSGQSVHMGWLRTFYPGSVEPSGAQAVDAPLGADIQGIDILLVKARLFRVIGTLAAQAPGFILILRSEEELDGAPVRFYSSHRTAHVRPDGRFDFGYVPVGSYRVSGTRGNLYVLPALVTVVDRDVTDLRLTTAATISMKTLISLVGEGPLPGGAICNNALNRYLFSCHVLEQRSFMWEGLQPGKIALRKEWVEGPYLKSAKWGGEEVLESGFELPAESTQTLELTLSFHGGRIDGQVVDGRDEPLPDARYSLISETPGLAGYNRWKSGLTDQNGGFLIRDIAPGEYKLYAWENDRIVWEKEKLKEHESKGHRLTIRDHDRYQVRIKVIPLGLE